MKTKLKWGRIWEFVKDFLAINLGMAIYALGWAAFLLPYHITTGGMTILTIRLGIAIVFTIC